MVARARSRIRRAPDGRRSAGVPVPLWGNLFALDVAEMALALLSLLAVLSLGGVVSPYLDALTSFEPLYLAAGLALIGVSLLTGPRRQTRWRWWYRSLGLTAAGCAAALALPDALASMAEAPAPPHPAATLRVLTQNVWGHNLEVGATAVGLRESGADVLLLQELDGPIRELPKALKQAYPYQADCTGLTEWCSLAILSKRPILRWSHHEPAWKPPVYDRLAYVRATIDGGAAGPVEIATTHLMHPDLNGPSSEQTAQFEQAVSDVDTRRGIIGGDFNSGPDSFALKRIDRGLPIPRRSHGIATWPNRMPWGQGRSRWPFAFLALDQIYAGRGWRLVSARSGPSTGSDHYGVVMTLASQP